ncbi:MAG: DUF3653 domain-containing protein [Lysobacterales bacterium]
MFNDETPAAWTGWHFQDDYLCSPNGDRFTPNTLMACFFVRQMETYRHALYSNWKQTLSELQD